MAVSRPEIEKWRTETRRGKSVFRLLALFGIVFALGLVAIAVSQQRSVSAATQITGLHNTLPFYDDSAGPAFRTNLAAEDSEIVLPDCEAGYEAVWQAHLTVGYASNINTTILGYMPGESSSPWALDVNSFSYDGMSYVVQNLVLQQVRGGISQLVLNTDQRLPDDLIFQERSAEYRIRDSFVFGANCNTHAWRMDIPLDWTEGEAIQVSLWRELDPGTQDYQPHVGPTPLDSLPDGPRVDGTLNAGETLSGEITALHKFKWFKLNIEPGNRYRIDMSGAPTGDGSLSDPWICGIEGI